MDKVVGNILIKILVILFIGLIFPVERTNPWILFSIPSNANDFSLVGSNVSEGTAGFYQFANPALLPNSNGKNFGTSYTMMSLDRSSQVLSVNYSLPPNAAVAISMMRTGTSDIQGRDIFNNNTELFNHHEILGMISFGISFGKYINGGLNIKTSYSNLDNIFGDNNEANYSISNNGIGFDGGILFNYSELYPVLGIKLENVGSAKNWSLNIDEQGNAYEEKVPVTYKIGAHYNITNQSSIFLCKDNSINNFFINSFAFKVDSQSKNMGLRLGVTIINKSQILPASGFYYSSRFFRLHYGFNFGSANEGISHIFSWNFTL